MLQKRFKVIAPMDKKEGGTWWLRCGSGFVNRDNSINLYIDALPTSHKVGPLQLQLRELDEEDLRKQNEWSQRRSTPASGSMGPMGMTAPSSSYSARGTLGHDVDPSSMPSSSGPDGSIDVGF